MSEFKFPDELEDADKVEVALGDDVELEIVDDVPAKDRNRKPLEKPVEDPTDDELGQYSEGVRKRLGELTHARHDERRAKEAALRERQELEALASRVLEENRRLKQYVNTGEQTFATTALAAAEAQHKNAQREYREAYESGDADKIMEAQEKLTDASLQMRAAKNFKPTALQIDEDDVKLPATAQQAPQIDRKTLDWQAKNQWFGQPGYEEMTSYSLGLHQKLVNNGYDPRSDEYFTEIDSRLRKTFRDFFEDSPDDNRSGDGQSAGKKPSTVVAPSTRSTGVKKIRLTTTQVALAKKLGLTPQQYAESVAKTEKMQNGR